MGLMTGDVSINPNARCIVMTTEILRSMLYRRAAAAAWAVARGCASPLSALCCLGPLSTVCERAPECCPWSCPESRRLDPVGQA